ncbi:MAG: RNA polymerase sigma factor [Calditrichia bacterium]
MGLGFSSILEGCRRGNVKSKEILFKHYYKRLNNFVRYLGIPIAIVEDVSQDVLIAAFINIATFTPHQKDTEDQIRASFERWLFKIARNKCVDYFNLNNRLPKPFSSIYPKMKNSLTKIPLIEDIGGFEKSIDIKLIENEAWDYITRVVSPEDSELIELRFLHGLPYNEIAKKIGDLNGAVRLRKRNARCLKKIGDFIITDTLDSFCERKQAGKPPSIKEFIAHHPLGEKLGPYLHSIIVEEGYRFKWFDEQDKMILAKILARTSPRKAKLIQQRFQSKRTYREIAGNKIAASQSRQLIVSELASLTNLSFNRELT